MGKVEVARGDKGRVYLDLTIAFVLCALAAACCFCPAVLRIVRVCENEGEVVQCEMNATKI